MKTHYSKSGQIFFVTVLIILGIFLEKFVFIPLTNPKDHAIFFVLILITMTLFGFAANVFYDSWPLWLWYVLMGWSIATIEQTTYECNVKVIDQSQILMGKIVQSTHYNHMSQFKIKVLKPNPFHFPPNYILLKDFSKRQDLHTGYSIQLKAKWKHFTPPTFPFEFNEIHYWRPHRVSHLCFLTDQTEIVILNQRRNLVTSCQNYFTRFIHQNFPNINTSGLIKAILLGDKTGISPSIKNQFKKIGALHLFAVSGLHVGFIFSLLYLLLLPLGFFNKLQPVFWMIILIGIWFFALISGFKIPVIRASILTSFYIVAKILQRPTSPWSILAWSALILLLWQPQYLFSIGFQLSFGAVLGIFLFNQRIYQYLIPYLKIGYLTRLISITLSAQIMITPLLIFYFQQISWLGIVSSILLIPILLPYLGGLCFHFLIGVFQTDYLTMISYTIVAHTTKYMTYIADKLSSLTWGFSYIYLPNHCLWIIVIGLIFMGISRLLKISRFILTWSFLPLCIFLLGFYSWTTRNQSYLIIYNHSPRPTIDIIFGGICYSNCPIDTHEYVTKNRSKHRVIKVVKIPTKFRLNQTSFQILHNKNEIVDTTIDYLIVFPNIKLNNTPYFSAPPHQVFIQKKNIMVRDSLTRWYAQYISLKLNSL